MKLFLRQSLHFILIVSFIFLPFPYSSVMAGEAKDSLNEECAADLKSAAEGKSTTGDQHMAYCVQADLARRAKNLETTKSIIFYTAATAAGVGAIGQAVAHNAARVAAAASASSASAAATNIPLIAEHVQAGALAAAMMAKPPYVDGYAEGVAAAELGATTAFDAAELAQAASGSFQAAAEAEQKVAALAKFCTITSMAATASGVTTDLVGKK